MEVALYYTVQALPLLLFAVIIIGSLIRFAEIEVAYQKSNKRSKKSESPEQNDV